MTPRLQAGLRAAAAAALLCGAAGPAPAQPLAPAEMPRFAQPVLGPRGPLPPDQEAGRQQLLAQARQALQAGDAEAAQAPLDRAAALQHAADTELLMVQQMMQRGAYRQALAFAAHAAGAHADVPQARALYAWLAAVGGQPAFADAQLGLGLQRLPDDAVLLGTRQALATLQAGQTQALPPPGALGPVATGAVLPAGARPVGSGLLLAGGQQALLVLAGPAPTAGQPLWVRDGLGRGRTATPVQAWPGTGQTVVWVRLDDALPEAAPLASASAAGFAGSPAVVVGHLQAAGPQPAWPVLHLGFLGRPMGEAVQALGIGLPAEQPGGAVFDMAGRLLGLTLPGDAAAPDRLLTLPALRALLGEQAPALLPTAPPGPRRTPDELYEQALPRVLQVLAGEGQPTADQPALPVLRKAAR